MALVSARAMVRPFTTVTSQTYTISGTVTNASAAAVPGGVVKLYNSAGSIIDSQVPNGSGQYTFSGLNNGTYYPMLHPPLGNVLKSTEGGAQSALYSDQGTVVVSGGNQTRNFDVVAPVVWDDFNFADTTALRSGASGYGNRNVAAGWEYSQIAHTDVYPGATAPTITMDATGGSAGQPAMLYTISSNNNTNCGPPGLPTANQTTAGLEIYPSSQGTGASEWWIRFRTKLSSNFQFGYTGCALLSYKYMLMYWGTSPQGRLMLGTFSDETTFGLQLSGGGSTVYSGHITDFYSGQRGAWVTWVIQMSGVGGTTTAKAYMNGALTATISCTGTFAPASGNQFFTMVPFNWDNGPDTTIHRWEEEMQVSYTRPSMIHGRAV